MTFANYTYDNGIYARLCEALKTCIKQVEELKHVSIVDELSDSDREMPWVEIGTDDLDFENESHNTEFNVVANFELYFKCASGPNQYNQDVDLILKAVTHLKNGVGEFGTPIIKTASSSFMSQRGKQGEFEGIASRTLDISFVIPIADIDHSIVIPFDE